jgi:hypothetical protein
MKIPEFKNIQTYLLYALIVITTVAFIALASYNGKVTQKDFATSFLALLGTFLGATLAFRLNETKELSKLHATQREALNRAMFVLTRQHNALHQLKSDLDKHKSRIELALNLPALKPPTYADLVHNFADLEFLLSSKNPNLLLKLTVEQERFHQALESLRVRNEFYVTEFQPAVAKLSLNGKSLTTEQLAEALGERIFGCLINGANNAQEHIYASCVSLPTMHSEIRLLAKEIYPNHKFINYEIPA